MTSVPAAPPVRSDRHHFLFWLGLLTVLAWLLREYFVLVTVVEAPIRGDIRQYVAYAWNLLHHGTFSQVWPGSGTPTPDSFRGPGYPLFLALWMALDAAPDGWYGLTLHAQAVLGALTVAGTVLLARHWLSPAWSLLAGTLLAVWPHHIAATGALLSEVVLGFLLVLALLLAARASKTGGTGAAIASGAILSCAFLVSPVTLLFPLLAATVFWRAQLPRAALALVLASLLAPAAWSLRNATIAQPADKPGRAALNLVQGSWPTYHRAYASRHASPIAREIIREIDREGRTMGADPRAGLAMIAERMAYEPGYYLRWYLIGKPWLLWDWDIRMGAGDVYFHRLSHSPLDRNPPLRAARQLLKALNPAIFVLSALASVTLLVGWLRARTWAPPAAALVAAFCIYVTAVHVVFQAEPRYAIPYRPMQLLMLASALALLAAWGRAAWGRSGLARRKP